MSSATPAEHAAWQRRRWLRWFAIAAVVIVIALSSFVLYYVALAITSQSCSVGFDTSTVPPPADASPQGWLCGTKASPTGRWIWEGSFIVSWLLIILIIVLAWRRWSWRGGIPALLLIVLGPYVTTWAMNLPSDECTAEVRATHPASDCLREQ